MIKLSDLKLNPSNPRFIRDEKFKKLCERIKKIPKMLSLRPIVIDKSKDNLILGGNMRYRALKELGYTEIQDDWVKDSNELNEEEKREFIVIDNLGYGEFDYEMLGNEYEQEELKLWGMDTSYFIENINNEENIDNEKKLLSSFEVIIECQNEQQQEKTFENLKKLGYVCKILTL
jgi:hypothetical protein